MSLKHIWTVHPCIGRNVQGLGLNNIFLGHLVEEMPSTLNILLVLEFKHLVRIHLGLAVIKLEIILGGLSALGVATVSINRFSLPSFIEQSLCKRFLMSMIM